MNPKIWHTPGWPGDLTALFAGALVTLSLAPYSMWVLGMLATTVLASLLTGLNGKRGFLRSFFFGIGLYGSGASWVYVSIYNFGLSSAPLAFALTSAFVIALALVFALPFYFYSRFLERSRWGFLLGFPAIWVLGEWSRTWFLTGFPWLFLGYSQHSTWLSGWAPVIGVNGLSFILVLTGVVLANTFYQAINCLSKDEDSAPHCQPRTTLALLFITCLCWAGGATLRDVNWTQARDEPVSVAVVQPNIPQEMKWNPMYRGYINQTLRDLAKPHWGTQLMIWPEAAIPVMYQDADLIFEEIEMQSAIKPTAVLTGILFEDEANQQYYNSIVGLAEAEGTYFKQRLVPFGEYVPLESTLRGIISFFDLPTSIISPGPKNQALIKTDSYDIATSICYEVVYPDLVAEYAAKSQVIVTISNDAWFGDSIGPLQHFEMARMRALENGRYLIRGTNTGISGIITPKGEVQSATAQFKQTVLTDEVYLYDGVTPFGASGSWPIVTLCILLCGFIVVIIRRKSTVAPTAQ